MAAHAKLSASAAHRWLNCPGSVRIAELFPATTSIFAEEGTLAHKLGESLILTEDAPPVELLERIIKYYQSTPQLDGTVDEMRDYVSEYADFVREEYEEALRDDPAAAIMTEQRVDLTKWIPGGFGTTDAAVIGGNTLHIIDLKYGKGVPVSAVDNPQLRLYALGTLDMLDIVYDIHTVKMTICQPRLSNISTDTISAKELRRWGEYVIKPGAQEALKAHTYESAGPWCQFCPGKATCRERTEHNLAVEEFKRQKLLSPEEIGEILGKADDLAKWASDLKEEALNKALAGEHIPGWKVVAGRALRKYKGTEEEIVRQAEGAGYDRALLYESKLLSVTAMEKLMGKKRFSEVMGLYIEKPEGKPTIVPEADKRPAINNNTAADDFADE